MFGRETGTEAGGVAPAAMPVPVSLSPTARPVVVETAIVDVPTNPPTGTTEAPGAWYLPEKASW